MAVIPFRDAAGNLVYLKSDNVGDSGDPHVPYRRLLESKVDDAAFAAGTDLVVPIGGVYQSTVDEGNAGDALVIRATQRRALITRPDFSILTLNEGTPVPAGSDIINTASGAIVAGDLAIRDTSNHDFIVPMLVSSFQQAGFQITVNTAFDQNLTVVLYARRTPAQIVATVMSLTLPAGVTFFAIGAHGSGAGGSVGVTTVVNSMWYQTPALQSSIPYWGLRFTASIAPTVGTMTVGITRS